MLNIYDNNIIDVVNNETAIIIYMYFDIFYNKH